MELQMAKKALMDAGFTVKKVGSSAQLLDARN
jgi:hypothetical protein